MTDYRPNNQELIRRLCAGTARLQADWRSYEVTMAELLDIGTVAGGGPSSGPSDPTTAQVLGRMKSRANWDEVTANVAEALGHVLAAQRLMSEVQRHAQAGQLADEAKAARCDGRGLEGHDEWGNPTCERNGVTRDRLCDACRQRRDHWVRKQDRAA